MPEQLSFPLPKRVSYDRRDFQVGEANSAALAQFDRDDWTAGKLILRAPLQGGKTHLARIWGDGSGAVYHDARQGLTAEAHPAVIVDNADAVAGDTAREEALFHLHNNQFNTGGKLLMTATARPGDWGIVLPDLASRIQATTEVAVGPPDDALLAGILTKLMQDRQLTPTADVIAHLVAQMDRRYATAARLVAALDDAALSSGRRISKALANQVLDADRHPGA